MEHTHTASWGALFRGKNGLLALALTGGVALHAINVHIVTTVLPSVVADIGGLDWYAWNTTLFVVTSIIGAALSVRLLAASGPRGACITALSVFAVGSAICGIASAMPHMLIGRSIQGLGGGALAALSYALIRIVFLPPLWPRAVALVSGMWGVATLCGPAIGGIFAQAGHWRWAFWSLLPIALLQALLVAFYLKPATPHTHANETVPRVPVLQILLLVASVLAVAAGSLSAQLLWQGAGIVLCIGLGIIAITIDRRATVRLLPSNASSLGAPLGAIYACIALLLIGTTTEIFVPYFLQVLHGHTPLTAGYMTAAMAAGWSVGSLASSGRPASSTQMLMRTGPLLCVVSLLMLACVIPDNTLLSPASTMTIQILALIAVGAGVGIGWPHLLTRVLTLAPANEGNTASAAITTIQLYGMAIGAAVAGFVVNVAGLSTIGGEAGARSASFWLFISFALAPAFAALLIRPQTHNVS
jgi:MFS family permease